MMKPLLNNPYQEAIVDKFSYHPIGIIHSPFKRLKGTPIQPIAAIGERAEVKIFPEYVEGLQDLDGFSHIILLYHCHFSQTYKLKVKPFLDDVEHGLFATRAPARPNPIGMSLVRLSRIEKATIYVQDVDIIDQTPLLDIKPFVPDFDMRKAARTGWMAKKAASAEKMFDDGRFGD
jgi:tRNA-Thr(GGU) m(6)t(6)A37 methyltransferase TsaA